MDQSIYQENGYKDRKDYLENLSEDYDVPLEVVFALAEMLGPNEDMDELINALEDYYG